MFTRTLVTLLLLLSASHIAAQPEAPAGATQDIEEIDVIGRRTTLSLRAETQRLEQDMFKLFNALNSNDEFDVACGDHTPTGSTIPLWQCEAAFMREAASLEMARMWDNRERNTTGVMAFGYVPRTGEQLTFLHRRKLQRLNDEMKALALEHPELATAMLNLHARRQQLEAMEKGLKP